MAVPSNIQNVLRTDFDKIRIGSNEHVSDKYVFVRPARLLYTELVQLKDWFDSSITWDDIVYDIDGDSIDIGALKYYISKIFSDQVELRDEIRDTNNYDSLQLPHDETEGRFPYNLSIYNEEFFDNDVLNRPYYRLWLNNRKIAQWVENWNNYGAS